MTPSRLHSTTACVAACGLSWLVWERPGATGTPLELCPWPAAIAGLLAAFTGLAARPRASWVGDVGAAAELASTAHLALLLPPALVLVVQSAALAVSGVVAGVCWLLWLALVLLAIAVQLLVFVAAGALAILGGTKGAESGESGEAFVGGCLGAIGGAGLVGLLAHGGAKLAGLPSAFDFSIVGRARDHRDWIPGWTVLLDRVRDALRMVDVGLGSSLLASVAAGVLGGLGLVVLLRALRRASSQVDGLRELVPPQVAPERDGEPVLDEALRGPVAVWLVVAWLVALVVALRGGA